METPESHALPDEPPPFFHTWNKVYAAVLFYLFLLIVVLYVITRMFQA
jgi:hypothetical protein